MPRLFVALECPGFSHSNLPADLGDKTGESFHITLSFLGDREDANLEIERIAPACRDKLPLSLVYRGLGAFQKPKYARVAWVGVDGNGLTDLANSIRAAANSEDRPFLGHISVARFRKGKNISKIVDEYRDANFGAGIVERVVLFSSVLSPDGAKHKPIAYFNDKGEVLNP